MRYRKFVFVVHIEFTIDVSIRNSRITIIVLSNIELRNQQRYKRCQYKTFNGEIADHLITPTKGEFFLSFHVHSSSEP